KDLYQCVRSGNVVTLDRRRGIVFDEAGVQAKLGVLPASIPDYLGLVGDAADGIPGIPRWGAKSASAVIAAHEHLEAIPEDHREWKVKVRGAATLAANLREHREDALLYRRLATLRTDAPISESLDDLQWRGPNRGALETLCEELGERQLLSRI
ncbi:MAG: flap endonuclease, partial [Deltaproteobacteria bacterium]|nr:flap endonuclease [Deltaproteobacteria bacterium]